jgi:hypothetical protein
VLRAVPCQLRAVPRQYVLCVTMVCTWCRVIVLYIIIARRREPWDDITDGNICAVSSMPGASAAMRWDAIRSSSSNSRSRSLYWTQKAELEHVPKKAELEHVPMLSDDQYNLIYIYCIFYITNNLLAAIWWCQMCNKIGKLSLLLKKTHRRQNQQHDWRLNAWWTRNCKISSSSSSRWGKCVCVCVCVCVYVCVCARARECDYNNAKLWESNNLNLNLRP